MNRETRRNDGIAPRNCRPAATGLGRNRTDWGSTRVPSGGAR